MYGNVFSNYLISRLLLWCSNEFVKLSCESFALIWPYSGSEIQYRYNIFYGVSLMLIEVDHFDMQH